MGKSVKIIIVVAVIAVGIFVFYFIRKKKASANTNSGNTTGSNTNSGNTTGTNSGTNNGTINSGNTSGNNTTQPINDGSTISQAEAAIRANNILTAMDKVGTDEQAIIENLKDLNKVDLLKVVTAFGVKPYYGTGLDTRTESQKNSIFGVFAIKGNWNMYQWLQAELSRKANETVYKIFKDNGLNF